jgi:hypothetical protein
MARERSKVRITDIRRAGKALQSIGVRIGGIEITEDRIAIITGEDTEHMGDLDEWLRKRGKASAGQT